MRQNYLDSVDTFSCTIKVYSIKDGIDPHPQYVAESGDFSLLGRKGAAIVCNLLVFSICCCNGNICIISLLYPLYLCKICSSGNVMCTV